MTIQTCPICGTATSPSERYPRHVCRSCACLASSADGRLLAFSNLDMFGGFVARYADTDELYDSHQCFIDGVRCHAGEARFGGIVIEPVEA